MKFSISVNELNQAMNIIDIRDEYQYKKGHIPNALHIPRQDLLINPKLYLNKGEYYYLYCNRGAQSMELSIILNELGYQVISIDGGYMEYKSKKGY